MKREDEYGYIKYNTMHDVTRVMSKMLIDSLFIDGLIEQFWVRLITVLKD